MRWGLWVSILLVTQIGFGQNMFTYRFSEYSGVHGILSSPSDFANSSLQYDFNIFSLETFAYNNYLFIENQSIFSTITNFALGRELVSQTQDNIRDGKDTARFALVDRPERNDKTVDFNLDIMGPSVAWSRGGLHNYALYSRFRAVTDIQDIHYAMAVFGYEGIRFRPLHNQDFLERFGRIQTMSWSEIAFNYSTNIIDDRFTKIAVGATIKRLFGYEAAYAEFENFAFRLQEQDVNDLFVDLQIQSGTVRYGRTNALEPAIPGTRNSRGKGWGMDFGFTAIGKGVRSYKDLQSNSVYLWKASIALTDFGYINFRENTAEFEFNRENMVYERFDTIGFPGLYEFDTMLSSQLLGGPDSSYVGGNFIMNTPRTVQARFEYRPRNRVSVGANAQIGLNGSGYGVYYPSVLSLHAQFGYKWLDIGTSMSLLEYNFFRMGTSMKLGPFFIGTDDLLAYFIPQELSSMSLYFGVKFSKLRDDNPNSRRKRPRKLKVNKCAEW